MLTTVVARGEPRCHHGYLGRRWPSLEPVTRSSALAAGRLLVVITAVKRGRADAAAAVAVAVVRCRAVRW
jgi:hypothetical protein